MAASITVRYSRTAKIESLYAYLLRVEVTAATDMPEEIFVFQRNVTSAVPQPDQPIDQFVCLADPVDLEEFPVGAPDLQNEMPYYRSKVVELLFRSITDLVETQSLIASDVANLVTTINDMAVIAVQEDVTYD